MHQPFTLILFLLLCPWFLAVQIVSQERLPMLELDQSEFAIKPDYLTPDPEFSFWDKWKMDIRAYHTPLAGEFWHTTIAGEAVHLLPRDRRKVMAINIGSSFFEPKIGDQRLVPFAAFYYKNQWEDDRRRFRAVVSGVVNYLDFADGVWNRSGWEIVAKWENFTIPFPTSEIVNGKMVQDSEIYWGHFLGGIGLGWRTSVFPYHCDNDLTVQLLYEAGYLYTRRTNNTGARAILPPDTYMHGMRLRMRLDSMDRNVVELPHRGFACGADFSFTRRDRWSDHQFGDEIQFSRESTRDYTHLTGYMVAAISAPFLSEHHRLLLSWHGGWSPPKGLDRFSAMRLGGGPNPSESNDLSRHPFPGALFDQFLLERYLLLTLEYRLELLFFLYAHVRGTFGWGRVAGLKNDKNLILDNETVRNFSVGITSGFVWNSLLYIEYAYDAGVLRNNHHGHGILLSWSKAL